MESDAARPSRRERPAKPALSREAIIAAALRIAHDEHVEAITMRRLAHALDTGPASLYVYFANQNELWTELFDAALAAVVTEPTDPARWREQLHELADRMVDVMAVRYPGLARLAMARIPVGENAFRVTESMLSLLKAGGMADQAAAYSADLVSLYVTAIAYEVRLHATLYDDPRHEEREVARLAERFATIDAERYPTMAALGPAMTRGDADERFHLGIDVLINGLLATPAEDRLTGQPFR
jgi:AcrR family transcriptional regulator